MINTEQISLQDLMDWVEHTGHLAIRYPSQIHEPVLKNAYIDIEQIFD